MFTKLALFMSLFLSHLPLTFSSPGEINLPRDCFKSTEYCTLTKIQGEQGSQVISIKFFARVTDGVSETEELVKKFINFKDWDIYTFESDEINIISSGVLSSRVLGKKRELSQYARYTIHVPSPFNSMKIVEKAIYRELEPPGGLSAYWVFKSDRDFAQHGIKRKDGAFKVLFNQQKDVYYVEINMEIVPHTAFLVSVHQPLRSAMTRLFLGMLDLEN